MAKRAHEPTPDRYSAAKSASSKIEKTGTVRSPKSATSRHCTSRLCPPQKTNRSDNCIFLGALALLITPKPCMLGPTVLL